MTDTTADWALFVAVVAILLTLIQMASASVQRRVTRTCIYYQVANNERKMVPGLVPWYTKAYLVWLWFWMPHIQKLMRAHHRVAFDELVDAVLAEKRKSTHPGKYIPDLNGDPLLVEAAAFLKLQEDLWLWRNRRRRRRRIRLRRLAAQSRRAFRLLRRRR